MNLRRIFKKNWQLITIIILAACFFGGTVFYNTQVHSPGFVKWGSPDETANYVFSKKYGNTGSIAIFEKYNSYTDDIIHPRSIRSDHGRLKPVSFLGIIIIYGTMVKWWGHQILPFLTPFFAALGIVFFYLLIKDIFGRRNAFISSFLMASFPVYIYYTARSMFHNVLFISLLIMALYFLVKAVLVDKEKPSPFSFFSFSAAEIKSKYLGWIMSALGGGALGLALSVRTSEALWILPLLFILWVFNIKKMGVTKPIIVLGFCFLALLPIAHWNQILYGSPISGGYPEMNRSIHNLTDSGSELMLTTVKGQLAVAKQIWGQIVDTIFYFGFDPAKSFQAFKDYVIKMFPALSLFALLGLVLFLQFWNNRKKVFWVYLLSYVVISAILIFYYGSWEFHDNPDATSATIGNSYTRYWLPVYLGALPLASFFIIRVSRGFLPEAKKKIRLYRRHTSESLREYIRYIRKERLLSLRTSVVVNGIRVVIVTLFMLSFLGFVLHGSEEGLIYTVQRSQSDKRIFQEVLDNTKRNGVIITQYHDKLLFPERKVVYGLFNELNMVERYSRIAEVLPLYYFNFSLSDRSLEYLNSSRLREFDLRIKEIKRISSDFTLYKLFKKKDASGE